MGDDLTETTMRGHPAFITNRPGYEPGDTEPSVMWLERPDLMITVSGYDDITLNEVLAAAESLQTMTDAQWDELQVAAALSSGTQNTNTTVVVAISAEGARRPTQPARARSPTTSVASTTTTASD